MISNKLASDWINKIVSVTDENFQNHVVQC